MTSTIDATGIPGRRATHRCSPSAVHTLLVEALTNLGLRLIGDYIENHESDDSHCTNNCAEFGDFTHEDARDVETLLRLASVKFFTPARERGEPEDDPIEELVRITELARRVQ